MAFIVPKCQLLFIMVPATGCSSISQVLQEKFDGKYIPENHLYKSKKMVLHRKHNSISDLQKHNCLSRIELFRLLKFGTVRNPFDVFATNYQRFVGQWSQASLEIEEKKLQQEDIDEIEKKAIKASIEARKKVIKGVKEKSFEEWLEGNLLEIHEKRNNLNYKIKKSIKSFIVPNYYPDACPLIAGVDEIIRYESLEEDFNKILRKVSAIDDHQYIELPNNNPTQGKKNYREYYNDHSRGLVEKYLEQDLKSLGYSF